MRFFNDFGIFALEIANFRSPAGASLGSEGSGGVTEGKNAEGRVWIFTPRVRFPWKFPETQNAADPQISPQKSGNLEQGQPRTSTFRGAEATRVQQVQKPAVASTPVAVVNIGALQQVVERCHAIGVTERTVAKFESLLRDHTLRPAVEKVPELELPPLAHTWQPWLDWMPDEV